MVVIVNIKSVDTKKYFAQYLVQCIYSVNDSSFSFLQLSKNLSYSIRLKRKKCFLMKTMHCLNSAQVSCFSHSGSVHYLWNILYFIAFYILKVTHRHISSAMSTWVLIIFLSPFETCLLSIGMCFSIALVLIN